MKQKPIGNVTPANIDMTDRSDWARVRAMTDDDIVFDEDSPRTTPDDWADAFTSHGAAEMRQKLAERRTRGPGKKPARIAIQLRLPPDVLERWKATGPGWQTRMAERLAL
jgi:uncharacterized protein (DUF4415 family)